MNWAQGAWSRSNPSSSPFVARASNIHASEAVRWQESRPAIRESRREMIESTWKPIVSAAAVGDSEECVGPTKMDCESSIMKCFPGHCESHLAKWSQDHARAGVYFDTQLHQRAYLVILELVQQQKVSRGGAPAAPQIVGQTAPASSSSRGDNQDCAAGSYHRLLCSLLERVAPSLNQAFSVEVQLSYEACHAIPHGGRSPLTTPALCSVRKVRHMIEDTSASAREQEIEPIWRSAHLVTPIDVSF